MPDSNEVTASVPPDIAARRASLTLPTAEPPPQTDAPWKDDLLGRQALATNLTAFLRPQREPLVLSLHGAWGSGKTFFLKRWVQALENEGFSTFYYNAWEDDYAPAPLIPILTKLEAATTDRAARRRLRQAALPFLFDLTTGALRAKTGVDLRQFGNLASLIKDDAVFEAYRNQRSHRVQLRATLASLAKSAAKKSGCPTVCVIDELDRCRPTFAIELLETMKHVFDVDGLVFVLALNRTELARSVRSVYGEIDADTYLRRFFDVHVDLPATDTAPYSRTLLARFGLDAFFEQFSALAHTQVHQRDYKDLANFLPLFWSQLRLSPRDIRQGVFGLTLTCRILRERHSLFPLPLIALLVVRLRARDLYRRFVSGDAPAAEVVDQIDSWIQGSPPEDPHYAGLLANGLLSIEASLYATHRSSDEEPDQGPIAELRRLADSESPTTTRLLSSRTATGGSERAKKILARVPEHHPFQLQDRPHNRASLIYLANLIDFVSVPDGGRT